MFFFISSHFMKSNVLTKKEQLQIRGVHDCMLITILIVIFQNLLSLMFFRHVWSHNLDFVKLTEISWRVHCYMLIKCFFSKFFSFVFFWQPWSQNLKFFKLTEIWNRGGLLYAYFDFVVCFFKIFVTHFFWEDLV